MAPEYKKTVRLLRFLASGAVIRPQAAAGMHVLRRSDGREMQVTETVLSGPENKGLITLRNGGLALTAEGRLWLKRTMLVMEDGQSGSDAFQGQHRRLARGEIEVGGVRQSVTINMAESPLAGLARLKGRDGSPFIEPDAIQAGERLRGDFTRAQMQPRISANWEASVSSGGVRAANGVAELTDQAVAARQRVERALAAAGPDLSGVLLDVCCFLKGLETVERERQWPARSAKLMVRAGLNGLSRHYGFRK